MTSTSWQPHSYMSPSPWVRAGPNDWLLMNRIWQKWWNAASGIRVQICSLISPALLILFYSPPHSEGCQPPRCKMETWQRTKKGLQPIANQEPRPWASHLWGIKSCHQPHELGSECCPQLSLQMRPQTLPAVWMTQQYVLEPATVDPGSWLQETVR